MNCTKHKGRQADNKAAMNRAGQATCTQGLQHTFVSDEFLVCSRAPFSQTSIAYQKKRTNIKRQATQWIDQLGLVAPIFFHRLALHTQNWIMMGAIPFFLGIRVISARKTESWRGDLIFIHYRNQEWKSHLTCSTQVSPVPPTPLNSRPLKQL